MGLIDTLLYCCGTAAIAMFFIDLRIKSKGVAYVTNNGQKFLWHSIASSQAKTARVYIEVAFNSPFDFIVEKNTWKHRIYRFLAIGSRPKSGDAFFDHNFYIMAENPRFINRLALNKELREAFIALLHMQIDSVSANYKSIEFKSPIANPKPDIDYVEKLLAPIETIKAQLSITDISAPSLWRKWKPFFHSVALWLPYAVFFGFGTSWIISTFFPKTLPPQIIMADMGHYFKDALIIAIIVWLYCLFSIRLLFAHSHRVGPITWIYICYIVLFLIITICATPIINWDWDSSKENIYSFQAEKKSIWVNATVFKHYKIFVTPDSASPKIEIIYVPKDMFYQISPGDTLCVGIKEGYLGYRWIASLDIKNSGSSCESTVNK